MREEQPGQCSVTVKMSYVGGKAPGLQRLYGPNDPKAEIRWYKAESNFALETALFDTITSRIK